jgi:hypothetical protein
MLTPTRSSSPCPSFDFKNSWKDVNFHDVPSSNNNSTSPNGSSPQSAQPALSGYFWVFLALSIVSTLAATLYLRSTRRKTESPQGATRAEAAKIGDVSKTDTDKKGPWWKGWPFFHPKKRLRILRLSGILRRTRLSPLILIHFPVPWVRIGYLSPVGGQ